VVALAVVVLSALPLACSSTGDDDDETTAETEPAQTTPAAPEEEQPLSGGEQRGRDLFAQTCGACHTLDAAGTQGQIGPNLDEIQVNEADVRKAIKIGGTGSGNMPSGLLSGQEAEDVAAFVAVSGPGP
jgi:sulfite dehydrogenase